MKKILYSVLAIAMAAFTFTSCEDVPAPYDDPNDNPIDEPVTIEPSGDGTETSPYNVAAIIAEAEKLGAGEESSENVYIKGIVTNITENYDGGYGNATYYISDDEDATNSFYIYRSKYFGNTSYSSGDLLEYGDTVVVYGKITNYNGIFETTQNGSYLISINGVTGGEQGGGDEPEGIITPQNGVYIDESFANNFGVFSEKTVKGNPWIIDFSSAKATGYDNASAQTTPSESYIVSLPIDFSTSKGATLEFQYILRYVTNYGEPVDGINNKVLITDNYTGDPATTSWTDITGTLTEGRDWTTWFYYSADIPQEFIGKENVVVALYYSCETSSGTWEVKNLTLKENGSSEEPGTGGEVSGNSITVEASSLGLSNGEALSTITLSDGTTLSFDGGGNQNAPKYYDNGTNIRMYPKNSMTVSSSKTITGIDITCDELSGTVYNASGDVTSTSGTVSTSGTTLSVTGASSNNITLTNVSQTTGAASQVRMTTLTIHYAE